MEVKMEMDNVLQTYTWTSRAAAEPVFRHCMGVLCNYAESTPYTYGLYLRQSQSSGKYPPSLSLLTGAFSHKGY